MLPLREIMTTDVVTVSPDLTLRAALEVFAEKHVSGAPVVAGGRVVGVVSSSDLLAFLAATPPERDAAPAASDDDDPTADDAPSPWDDGEEEPSSTFFNALWRDGTTDVADRMAAPPATPGDPLAEHTVEEVMTRLAFSLSPAADVTMAADYMRTVGVHRILVMDGDALVGIVSASDIARAVADHRLVRRTYVFDRT